jgi:hypothetical protein
VREARWCMYRSRRCSDRRFRFAGALFADGWLAVAPQPVRTGSARQEIVATRLQRRRGRRRAEDGIALTSAQWSPRLSETGAGGRMGAGELC